MYEVKYNKENDLVEISFSGNFFHDIKNIVKSHAFKYNPDKKIWTHRSAILTLEKVIPELQLVESGKISFDVLSEKAKQEKENDIPYETKFYHNTLLAEALRSKPIQGKPPYENFQLKSIEKGIRQNRLALFLQMGLGKEQPLSSKILTPIGWKTMGDIQIGDRIVNSNGTDSKVIGKFPQGVKDVYKITFNDGSSTRCGEDHLWSVRAPYQKWIGNENYYALTTKEIISRGLKDGNGNSQFEIPLVNPIHFRRSDHIISPYLMGALIGDGGLTKKVTISNQDDDLIKRLYNCVKHLGMTVNRLSLYDYSIRIKDDWRGKKNPIKQELIKLGLFGKKSNEKFIPTEYLFDSVKNRKKLFQGLMDTDGYVSKDNTLCYYSCSERLIEDVKFLVQSLGGIARKSFRNSGYFCKKTNEHIESKYGVYTLTISIKNIDPFYISRKRKLYKEREKYSPTRFIESICKIGREESACIMTSAYDYLYVTDECILTHNTFIVTSILNQYYLQKRLDKILIVCPGEALYNWRRELIRFSVFAQKKDDVLISTADDNRNPLEQTEKNVVVMTYRHYLTLMDDYIKKNKSNTKKPRKPVIPWEEWGSNRAMVLDESHCFSYGTLIETSAGPMSIGEIVENKIDIEILSYNHLTHRVEYKKINNYFKHNIKKTSTNLIKVGEDFCTKNHPFFTNSGYKKIGEICEEEKLLILSKNIRSKFTQSIILLYRMFRSVLQGKQNRREKQGQKTWLFQLRMVWKKNDSGSSFLFNKLFCKMEDEPKTNKRENIYTGKNRKIQGNQEKEIRKRGVRRISRKNFEKNEREKSNVQPKIQGKNETNFNRHGALSLQERRKRSVYKTTIDFMQRVTKSVSKSLYYFRRSGKNSEDGKKYSQSLQNRHRNTRIKNRNRSRWEVSSNIRRSKIRRKENKDFKRTWMEYGSLFESGYIRKHTESNEGYISVYNLEIEDNNNYFANNFLVHNCIKNHKARQTHAISLHKDAFNYRYILTGTPTPNGFEEIYNQIKFLDERALEDKNYYGWLEDIAVLGDRFSRYAINSYKRDGIKKQEEKFSLIVLRYKSDEVLDLPELYIKPEYVELTDIQKKIYNHLINYVIYKIKEEHGRIVPKEVRNQFAFIVQAYENACLLKGKISSDYSREFYELVENFKFDNKYHAKLNIVDSLLSEYIGTQKQKVAIIDYHPLTIEQLAEHYKKHNPVVIHGQNTPKGMSKEEFRNLEIERFKHDSNCNLLVGSSKVLSTAINLTECKRVIYFSRDFSYLSWSQSIKRFHRIGSTERVIINPIISEETLEERVETALQNKKDLDETIFKKDSITLDEWKQIFKGN